jgi:hypothetical protein
LGLSLPEAPLSLRTLVKCHLQTLYQGNGSLLYAMAVVCCHSLPYCQFPLCHLHCCLSSFFASTPYPSSEFYKRYQISSQNTTFPIYSTTVNLHVAGSLPPQQCHSGRGRFLYIQNYLQVRIVLSFVYVAAFNVLYSLR